jgi:hypothetical protein
MKKIIIDLIVLSSITMGILLMTYYCTARADRICSEYSKGNQAKYKECLGL